MATIAQDDAQNISRTIVGTPPNHWIFSPNPPTYDLTRPSSPNFPPPSTSKSITLTTTTEPIIINPEITALVIVGMQNFFLSTHLPQNPPDSEPNKAKRVLLEKVIPAARKAGIKIVWLGWGLEEKDLQSIDAAPPAIVRIFGFDGKPKTDVRFDCDCCRGQEAFPVPNKVTSSEMQQPGVHPKGAKRRTEGIGFDQEDVDIGGETVKAGKLLMKGSWNMEFPPDLGAAFKEGDLRLDQTRLSGFSSQAQPNIDTLRNAKIKTLLFSGTKTDVCAL